jgi:peptidylprolyl isomerase
MLLFRLLFAVIPVVSEAAAWFARHVASLQLQASWVYNQRQNRVTGEVMTDELKIEDLVPGEGKAAERGALITAHYRGWLEDGTEFDSSYKRGEAFQCILSNNRVIQGWILGLKGMRVGGKRKLWVPAHLAYGERQIGSMIPPHSNLIFEIELLEVLTRDD